MMVMQGFFDDSGSGSNQRIFVLAGFVSWAANWAMFSDEWESTLKADPPLSSFKWHEAAILRKQFDGWLPEQAQAKKLALAHVAKKYAMLRVRTSISWDQFNVHRERAKQYWPKNRRLPPIIDNPYFLLFFNIVLAVAHHRRQWGWDMQMDYIFDVQSRFSDDAMRYWDIAVEMMPDKLKPYAGQRPIHRSDNVFRPLQAADLYAGAVRACLLEPAGPGREIFEVLREVPHTDRALDDNILEEAVEHMASDLELRRAIEALER